MGRIGTVLANLWLLLPMTGLAEGLVAPVGSDAQVRALQQSTCLANSTGELKHAIGLNDDLASTLFRDKETRGFLSHLSLSGPRLIQERSDGVLGPADSLFNAIRSNEVTNRFVLCLFMYGYKWENSAKDGIAEITDLAASGNASAQSTLGLMYYRGHGLKLDQGLAIEWIRKAAEQDYGLAQYNLAVAYLRGEGVPLDVNEAIPWLRKAAAKGYAPAQEAIAEIDKRRPLALPSQVTSTNEVAKLEQQSGEDTKVIFELAEKYEDGNGVSRDIPKAISLYRKAAELGHVPAQGYLGVIYDKARGVPQDDIEAIKWYRLAAEKGYAQSQFNLGVFLITGRGTARNEEEGWDWVRKAAANGHEPARAALTRFRK